MSKLFAEHLPQLSLFPEESPMTMTENEAYEQLEDAVRDTKIQYRPMSGPWPAIVVTDPSGLEQYVSGRDLTETYKYATAYVNRIKIQIA